MPIVIEYGDMILPGLLAAGTGLYREEDDRQRERGQNVVRQAPIRRPASDIQREREEAAARQRLAQKREADLAAWERQDAANEARRLAGRDQEAVERLRQDAVIAQQHAEANVARQMQAAGYDAPIIGRVLEARRAGVDPNTTIQRMQAEQQAEIERQAEMVERQRVAETRRRREEEELARQAERDREAQAKPFTQEELANLDILNKRRQIATPHTQQHRQITQEIEGILNAAQERFNTSRAAPTQATSQTSATAPVTTAQKAPATTTPDDMPQVRLSNGQVVPAPRTPEEIEALPVGTIYYFRTAVRRRR